MAKQDVLEREMMSDDEEEQPQKKSFFGVFGSKGGKSKAKRSSNNDAYAAGMYQASKMSSNKMFKKK